MKWVTPDKLFICVSKFDPAHSESLRKAYGQGPASSPEIEDLRREHLRYVYELGKEGITVGGGALGQFQGTLSVYAVNSLAEAEKARENDPYYKAGKLFGAEYHEWIIHMPFCKASPAHREIMRQGLIDAGIKEPRETLTARDNETPAKLFACFYKGTPRRRELMAKTFGGAGALSPEEKAIRMKHLRYGYDLGEKGITWGSGPFVDGSGGLSIYGVNSVEEARKIKENDPYYHAGNWTGLEYFQWFIHMPLDRAVPERKEKLRQSLVHFGILPK